MVKSFLSLIWNIIRLILGLFLCLFLYFIFFDEETSINNSNEDVDKVEVVDNWNIKYFVDSFGDPTDSAYLDHRKKIRGKFSNSATTDSKLDIDILISDGNDGQYIRFTFFEYARKTPKHFTVKDGWTFQVKHDQKMMEFESDFQKDKKYDWVHVKVSDKYVTVVNRDIGTTRKGFDVLINEFKNGGEFKFLLATYEYDSSVYQFTLNIDGEEFSKDYAELLKLKNQ